MITCRNSKCIFYLEDHCWRSYERQNPNLIINLDENGKCEDFKKGQHDYYKQTNNNYTFKVCSKCGESKNMLPSCWCKLGE